MTSAMIAAAVYWISSCKCVADRGRRLFRFHVANGFVSIVSNIVLTYLYKEVAGLPLVTANFAAILTALAALTCALVFRIRMLIPTGVPDVRVTLILPATGALPGLADLFEALRSQTLRPARLIIAVESQDDPAFARATKLAQGFPDLAIELVVAGLSGERAQKCTNILAALERLRAEDAYIVLFDADIRPQPWWLASLVGPLVAGSADIVNGYRWQVPQRVSLATVIGTAIDRGIAVLLRLGNVQAVWGGSVAFTRPALAALDLPVLLARAATEDGVIGTRAEGLGLHIVTRRGLRLPTPLGGSLLSLWRFARRQYQLVRLYRPGVWLLACGVCTADLLTRATLIFAAFAAGAPAERIAIPALFALGVLGSITAELRFAVGRRLGVADPVRLVFAHHALVWSFLPAAAFHASAIWAGFFYSPIVWAHVRYTVDRQGRVIEAVRAPHPNWPQ